MRAAIETLAHSRERMQVVVTCRSAAYKERTLLGGGFQEVRVKPLNQNQVTALVEHAYGAYYAQEPRQRQVQTQELLQGILHLESERQRRFCKDAPALIDSPLLVRMLLIVHLSNQRIDDCEFGTPARAVDR